MHYDIASGVNNIKTKLDLTKLLLLLVALALPATIILVNGRADANSNIPANAGSNGKVTLDTDIGAGINYGSGIPNGEWVVASNQGVELGLRTTDRTDGLLDVSGTNGNRIGVYNASTGFDGTTTNIELNGTTNGQLTFLVQKVMQLAKP